MFLSRLIVFFTLAYSLSARAAEINPVKLATGARFDLTASASVGTLSAGHVSRGQGSIARQNWLPEGQRERGYSVNFSLNRLASAEIEVRFEPKAAGNVTLSLMGPWEEASKGLLYKAETEWRQIEVTGASIAANGWSALPKPVVSWHNRPVALTLQVQAGQPVTLRAQARPVVPAGFVDMKRITRRDTPAHLAAKNFMRGANLGNYLEAPPAQNWGACYSAGDFAHIKAEGFDHVRLPIAWNHHTGPGPDFKLSDEIYGKADFLVTNALANGLNVIMDIHHFDDFTTDLAANSSKFYALWRQIAAHYAKSPAGVAFELLNEPKDAATTTAMNPIYAETIRQIRRSNPGRVIFVGPGKWNQVGELPDLRLPDDDENLIVTLHCYDPFYFTHQGATWSGPDTKVKGIRFPGPPSEPLVPDAALQIRPHVKDWIARYNTLPTERNPSSPSAFKETIRKAKEWSDHYGRPVHMGEFGCFSTADPESRARFYAEFRKALAEAGLGWAIWDWSAGFRYWDQKKGEPMPGMREALFGK